MFSHKDFDFYQHVYEILRQRTTSGFIPYYEVYSYLGRRFCLRKWEIKELIKSMECRGYLMIKKRGIILIEQRPGKGEKNGCQKNPSNKQDSLRRFLKNPEDLSV